MANRSDDGYLDAMEEKPLFRKESLPEGSFQEFEKVRRTMAMRIEGTFHCLTSEGNLASCTDGWLALDSKGHPYPINAEEFDLTYRPISQRNRHTE
jgi:hypothetical protein